MKYASSILGLLFGCLLMSSSLSAQGEVWKTIQEDEIVDPDGIRELFPKKAAYFDLRTTALRVLLQSAPDEEAGAIGDSPTIIPIPFPDGEVIEFRVVQYQMLEPELAAKYPNIRNYKGVAVDDPTTTIRFDWTARGFRAMLRKDGEQIFIDPYSRGTLRYYMSYFKRDYARTGQFGCQFEGGEDNHKEEHLEKSAGDCQLRTYRLAVATTAEYSNYHGASSSAQSNLVLAEVNTAVNRINEVYERDLSVRFILIGNTDDIFYYNPNTDPYSNGNVGAMIGQNQTNINSVIGSANYDIGHVFGEGVDSGVATLRSTCDNSSKARGVTSLIDPVGDPFYIDYAAHEIGHQFGGNHTQNNACQRSGASYEPGSASTIMGYAGICSPNVQNNSDAYFHAISIQEISNYITTGDGDNCPVKSTTNVAPTVTDPGDFSIPRGTPFVLSTMASDPNNDPLTYCWEQWDPEVATMPPVSTSTQGPLFRSLEPTTSTERYFINLPDLAAGVDPTWEELPTVARNMEFRVTVRDNNANYGCTDEVNINVTVTNSSPFVVQAPNANVTLNGGQTFNVQWDEAQTAQSPISCGTVDIFLSTDGGLSFPTLLLGATSNDGSQTVTLPNIATTTARIMVKCATGIFFDISDTNFEIQAASNPDYTLSANPTSATNSGANSVTYTIDVGSIQGYSDPVTLAANGLPSGANASFSTNPVTPGNSSTLTVSNLSTVSDGNYNFTVNATSTSGNKSLNLTLIVSSSTVTPCLQFDSGPFINFEPPTCYPNCQTPTTAGFEVFANESYLLRGLTIGAEYTFEFCNGYDPNTWAANITAAEWNDISQTATANIKTVSGCTITFIATTVDAIIIIFDTCGNTTLEVGNGFPTFQCTGNGPTLPDACPPLPAGCAISEDFEAGQPVTGWTFSTTGTGASWDFDANPINSVSNPGSGIWATYDDDATGNNGQNNIATATSPTVDMSNFTDIELSFDYGYDNFGSDVVFLTIQDGTTTFYWTGTVWSTTSTVWLSNADQTGTFTEMIPAGLNLSALSVTLQYNDNNEWAWGFGFDNFSLCGDETSNPCPPNLAVNDNPVPAGTYSAQNTLTSTGTVAAATTVTFEAGQSITLSPGFTAAAGSTFTARIQSCAPTTQPEIEARVAEVVLETAVNVFPNPFSNQTTIELELVEANEVQIELYSLTGQRIKTIALTQQLTSGKHQFFLDAHGLTNGMYVLMTRIGDTIQTTKVSLVR